MHWPVQVDCLEQATVQDEDVPSYWHWLLRVHTVGLAVLTALHCVWQVSVTLSHWHCDFCAAHASWDGYALEQDGAQAPVAFTTEQMGLASHCVVVAILEQACWHVPVDADQPQLESEAQPVCVGYCSVQDSVQEPAPLYWHVLSSAQAAAVVWVVQASLQVFVATFHVHAVMAVHRPWLAAAEQRPSHVLVTLFHWQELSALQPVSVLCLAEQSVVQVLA